MATEVGSAYVTLIPSAKGFASKMQGELSGAGTSTGTAYGNEFSKSAGSSVTSKAKGIFKGIGKAALIAGGVAGVALGKLMVDSVSAASDLNETMSKTEQIFGKRALPALTKFADAAATSLGQSKTQALDAAATFGVFGKSAGLTGKDLGTFSTDFTALASDMASFNNTSPEEAITAIGAALRGENEPIRRYGVLLDDASLRQEALKQGIVTTTKDALTPQQKVLAAQALIYKQTADQQGDFAKTSGGLANQQRIAAAQFETLKTTIGQGLLPVFVRVAHIVTEQVMPALQKLAEKHMPAIRKALLSFTNEVDVEAIFAKISDSMGKVDWDSVSEGFNSLTDSGKELGPLLAEFSEQLPGISDTLTVTSEVFGFLADHADTLAKLMPYLVAGFVAFKVAQAAANAAALLALPTKIAEVVVTRQLVKSNRELIASRTASAGSAIAESVATGVDTVATGANTVAQNTNTTATKKGIIASVRSKVAAIASSVATYVVAAATAVWTAAQWLLNAALSANPIALVIIAILALVAVLILAYKKSETFRKIVDAVFGFLKDAVTGAINFIKDHWKTILVILLGPIAIAIALLIKYWDKIKAVFSNGIAAVVGFVKKLPGRIMSVLRGLGNVLRALFSKAWSFAKSAVSSAVTGIVNVVKGIPKKLAALGGLLKNAGKALLQKLLEGLGAATGFAGDLAQKVWDAIKSFINAGITELNDLLEFTIDIGPKSFTVNPIDIPTLAGGARATAATLAVIGEGREPESVLPDSMLRGLLERAHASASGQVGQLTITNWQTGQGYFRTLASEAMGDDASFRRNVGAMNA